MSADTPYQQVREHLAALRLTTIADRLAPALEQAERERPGYTLFLADLLAAEVHAVEQRRLQGRLRFARLPARKTLEQFDFSAQPSLDRRLVEDLATLRFIDERANVLLIGPPGVGKTMLATALGHRAVEHGYRVYYTTAADLVARTARAALEGRWATTMRFWNGPQLLLIDELGYLPMPAETASHLVPSHQPPLRTRQHRPDNQPRHRRLGPHLRRHHRRRRHPRPAPPPRHRPLDHRRQLPHAPPPRHDRSAPTRPHRPPHTWGILIVGSGEFSSSLTPRCAHGLLPLRYCGGTGKRPSYGVCLGKWGVVGYPFNRSRMRVWLLRKRECTTRARWGELQAWFPTDADCLDYLEWLRWPDGFVCPGCGHAGGWKLADGRLECAACAARTSPTAGTIFDRTRTPLTVWLIACWLFASQKDGISALSLKRLLEIGSYQTAWAMLHRLRSVLVRPGRERLAGEVEVDESYFGGEEPGLRGGRQKGKKVLVGIAVERTQPKGLAAAAWRPAPRCLGRQLRAFLADNVEPGARVITDGWRPYRPATAELYVHEPLTGASGPECWATRLFGMSVTSLVGIGGEGRPNDRSVRRVASLRGARQVRRFAARCARPCRAALDPAAALR